MFQIIENLRRKPESYRHKIALFTSTTFSLIVFVAWASFNGFIGMPKSSVAEENPSQNTATVSEASLNLSEEALSPLGNSKSALKAALDQFSAQFGVLKESLSNVLVPFMSGIEVYESK